MSETENVRTVARLMVGSDSMVLPVVEDGRVRGIVSADGILQAVSQYLGVLTVADVATDELVTADPESTLGAVIHDLRDHRITHMPVVDGDSLVGIVSLYDLMEYTAREMRRSQGGSPGKSIQGRGRSHGGFGAREGEIHRMLELPIRDMMSTPVGRVRPDESLETAVERMAEQGGSSLVVVDGNDRPRGIVTKTDVLRSLTWSDGGRKPIRVYGVELMDGITYDEVASMIDELAGKYSDMTVMEAKIHLHEHEETLRGTPLILARIRLFTDRGLFIAAEEGFGAKHALHLARNVLEREIPKGKTYGQTKKHPDEEFWEHVQGWWLTG
ncbi:MAG: CBS domain-containing protein [Halobacteriota archaeon]